MKLFDGNKSQEYYFFDFEITLEELDEVNYEK